MTTDLEIVNHFWDTLVLAVWLRRRWIWIRITWIRIMIGWMRLVTTYKTRWLWLYDRDEWWIWVRWIWWMRTWIWRIWRIRWIRIWLWLWLIWCHHWWWIWWPLTRHVGCGCMTETERFLVDRLLETELAGSSACEYKNIEIQKYKSFLNLNSLQDLCYKFHQLFAFQNQSNEGRVVTIMETVMLFQYKIQSTSLHGIFYSEIFSSRVLKSSKSL